MRTDAGNLLVIASVREPVADKRRFSSAAVGLQPTLFFIIFLVVQVLRQRDGEDKDGVYNILGLNLGDIVVLVHRLRGATPKQSSSKT